MGESLRCCLFLSLFWTVRLSKHTWLPLSTHIQMWMVILKYWVSLSRDKSGRLICPVRGWRLIGHIWPPALRTVGTQALSYSGNWLMKHFRNSSTRLSSTSRDWVRHECVYKWPRGMCERAGVCACKQSRENGRMRNSLWPSLRLYQQHQPHDAHSILIHWQNTHKWLCGCDYDLNLGFKVEVVYAKLTN